MPQPANAAPDWADLEVAALYRKWRGTVLPRSEIAAALRRAKASGLRQGAEACAGGAGRTPGDQFAAGYARACVDMARDLERLADATTGTSPLVYEGPVFLDPAAGGGK